MSGWDPSTLRGLTAFTIGGITGIALPQLGPLILQRVAAVTQIGYFAAASRIPGLLYAIPGCLGMAWYPQLFSAGARDPAQHFALSVDQLKINAILSFGLSLPVALYSRPLIRIVLGTSWEAPTAPILSLLCWMVVLNSLSTPFADALTTKGLQDRRAYVYVAALVIGSALFAVLGSIRGAIGAATAAIITQSLLSVSLVLVNPSGRALLSAAGRRFVRPICMASAPVFIIHQLLPNNLISAGVSVITFFLVAVASDFELRMGAKRTATFVNSKWRCACIAP
jgi:O-antigen/teichoic acid export membrane protein